VVIGDLKTARLKQLDLFVKNRQILCCVEGHAEANYLLGVVIGNIDRLLHSSPEHRILNAGEKIGRYRDEHGYLS
jgi:hypothetical protein